MTARLVVRLVVLIYLVFSAAPSSAQSEKGTPRLMQGPMIGAVQRTSALIWARASGEFTLAAEASTNDRFDHTIASKPVRVRRDDDFTASLAIEGLEPGTEYFVRVLVEGKVDTYERGRSPARFRTAPAGSAKFRVCFGSCARYQYDREQPIWSVVSSLSPDLFFWLGDNIYGDSLEGQILAEEYRRQREVPLLEAINRRVPQLAVWDDHDYGLNNHDSTSPMRETALTIFRRYWPNPSHGLADTPGVFFKYSYGGVDFYFLDGRTYRTPNDAADGPEKHMLGDAQIRWLLDDLSVSKAAFKVLISGSGWTAGKGPKGDAWSAFLTERDHLFAQLAERRVSGVILLSGDTHYGELNLIPRSTASAPASYDLYELVSSPLAQLPNQSTRKLTEPEKRLRPAFNFSPNVGVVEFDTTAGDPTVALGLYNVLGRQAWEPLTLTLSQLGGPAAPAGQR